MIGTALFVFPKLALGLSGFETGVVVMPLVKGESVIRVSMNRVSPHLSRGRRINSTACWSHSQHSQITHCSGPDHELPAFCEQHHHHYADSR